MLLTRVCGSAPASRDRSANELAGLCRWTDTVSWTRTEPRHDVASRWSRSLCAALRQTCLRLPSSVPPSRLRMLNSNPVPSRDGSCLGNAARVDSLIHAACAAVTDDPIPLQADRRGHRRREDQDRRGCSRQERPDSAALQPRVLHVQPRPVDIEEAAHPRADHHGCRGGVPRVDRLVYAVRDQAQHRLSRRGRHGIGHSPPTRRALDRTPRRARRRT
jgi:hypothetical protein